MLSTSQAIVVSISGSDFAVADNVIQAFVQANFTNVTTVNYGNYANPANIPVGTDLLITGRRVFSGDYANTANTAIYNSLTIPVVALTSYITRPDPVGVESRWGWHSGGAAGSSLVGDETTVTAAGVSVFGAEGSYNWWNTLNGVNADNFNAAGTGTVGTGDILATIGGNILVAAWEAGDTLANGQIAGGTRLLFNIPDFNNAGGAELPNTLAGQIAFQAALDAYTPLTAGAVVPEPSGSALLIGSLGLLTLRRRRTA